MPKRLTAADLNAQIPTEEQRARELLAELHAAIKDGRQVLADQRKLSDATTEIFERSLKTSIAGYLSAVDLHVGAHAARITASMDLAAQKISEHNSELLGVKDTTALLKMMAGEVVTRLIPIFAELVEPTVRAWLDAHVHPSPDLKVGKAIVSIDQPAGDPPRLPGDSIMTTLLTQHIGAFLDAEVLAKVAERQQGTK